MTSSFQYSQMLHYWNPKQTQKIILFVHPASSLPRSRPYGWQVRWHHPPLTYGLWMASSATQDHNFLKTCPTLHLSLEIYSFATNYDTPNSSSKLFLRFHESGQTGPSEIEAGVGACNDDQVFGEVMTDIVTNLNMNICTYLWHLRVHITPRFVLAPFSRK